MKLIRIMLAVMFAFGAVLPAFTTAQADIGDEQWYSFTISCSNNNPDDVATGMEQLFVRVKDIGNNQVEFYFTNTGPKASSITGVYFDDGELLGIADIINGPGVKFSQGAAPPDLPGGQDCDPPFNVTAGFLADSDPPVEPNGVGPGEWLIIIFDLKPGKTYSDIIADLGTGALRIGIHVQGFDGGGSESFINDGFTAVSLDSFEATSQRGQVSLTWSTGSEINNAGFNLYRASSINGQLVKVNGMLMAARGNEVSGAGYSFTDVPGYGTFYYWLEDVEYTGVRTLHGPLQVDVVPSFQRPLYRPTLPGMST
jgi:hypothetical protein